MKHIIYTLLLTTLFSCLSKKEETGHQIAVRATLTRSYDSTYLNQDSFTRKNFDVTLSIINKENGPVSFWLMSCSWEENFITNRDYLRFHRSECDHNVPQTVALSPKDSAVYRATVSLHGFSSLNTAVTGRFGFIFVDSARHPDMDEYLNILNDKSRQDQIEWSNPVTLRLKK